MLYKENIELQKIYLIWWMCNVVLINLKSYRKQSYMNY